MTTCFICNEEIEGSKLNLAVKKEKNTLYGVNFTLQEEKEPPALKFNYCHPKCMVDLIRMQSVFCEKCKYQIAQCNICGKIDCLKTGWVCACGFVVCRHCEETDIDDQGTVNCRNCGTDKHWEEPESNKLYSTLPFTTSNRLDYLIKIELNKMDEILVNGKNANSILWGGYVEHYEFCKSKGYIPNSYPEWLKNELPKEASS